MSDSIDIKKVVNHFDPEFEYVTNNCAVTKDGQTVIGLVADADF